MSTRNHTIPLVRAPVLNMVGGLALLLGSLLGLVALPAPPIQTQGGWAIECVDCPKRFYDMTDRSLVLDGSGYPHISYYDSYNDALKYAYQDGVAWHTETVDSAGAVGQCTSLALDGSDYPHISYYDATNAALKYAYQDGAGWHTETVDSPPGNLGEYTSLALDGSGYPHISYNYIIYYAPDDVYIWVLQYAYQDGAGWHTETVDSAPDNLGRYTSLALDGSGYPHISYHDWSPPWDPDGDLTYAYQDGAGWHTKTVDSAGWVGLYTSLALDGSGYPHISYYDSYNDALKYAYQDGAGWHTETVDSADDVGYYTSLALPAGGSGYPHISYLDGTNTALKYAYQDGAGWHIETVDSAGDVGSSTSLALDGSGYPHISYYDYGNADLKYAYQWPVKCRIYLPLILK